MKRISVILLLGFLSVAPVRAQTGLEGLLVQLLLPAVSSVFNTAESVVFSTSDLATIFADADTFIEQNEDELLQDIARGKGEYLDALSDLMEIPDASRAAFNQDLKRRYLAQKASTKG